MATHVAINKDKIVYKIFSISGLRVSEADFSGRAAGSVLA